MQQNYIIIAVIVGLLIIAGTVTTVVILKKKSSSSSSSDNNQPNPNPNPQPNPQPSPSTGWICGSGGCAQGSCGSSSTENYGDAQCFTSNSTCQQSCTQAPCSSTYPVGRCDPNKSCVGGQCLNNCGSGAPCSTTQSCVSNQCLNNCSSGSPNGYCPTNQVCLNGGCSGYTILNPGRYVISAHVNGVYTPLCLKVNSEGWFDFVFASAQMAGSGTKPTVPFILANDGRTILNMDLIYTYTLDAQIDVVSRGQNIGLTQSQAININGNNLVLQPTVQNGGYSIIIIPHGSGYIKSNSTGQYVGLASSPDSSGNYAPILVNNFSDAIPLSFSGTNDILMTDNIVPGNDGSCACVNYCAANGNGYSNNYSWTGATCAGGISNGKAIDCNATSPNHINCACIQNQGAGFNGRC